MFLCKASPHLAVVEDSVYKPGFLKSKTSVKSSTAKWYILKKRSERIAYACALREINVSFEVASLVTKSLRYSSFLSF